jgi:hypothetical protein
LKYAKRFGLRQPPGALQENEMAARFLQEHLCANDKPPPPIGTPVSSRLSDQLAPTRQHQPTHAPFLSNRGKLFNHSRKSAPCFAALKSLTLFAKLTARPLRSGSGRFGLGRDLPAQFFHPLLGVYELFGSQLFSQKITARCCI